VYYIIYMCVCVPSSGDDCIPLNQGMQFMEAIFCGGTWESQKEARPAAQSQSPPRCDPAALRHGRHRVSTSFSTSFLYLGSCRWTAWDGVGKRVWFVMAICFIGNMMIMSMNHDIIMINRSTGGFYVSQTAKLIVFSQSLWVSDQNVGIWGQWWIFSWGTSPNGECFTLKHDRCVPWSCWRHAQARGQWNDWIWRQFRCGCDQSIGWNSQE
jgi:hypothetical protein